MKHANGTKEIDINGKKFTAQYTIEVEDNPIDFETLTDGMDEKDIRTLERDLERGDCSIVMIICTARLECFSGSDCLGAVFYYQSSDIDDAVTSHGMIENACLDLVNDFEMRRDWLSQLLNSLTQ